MRTPIRVTVAVVVIACVTGGLAACSAGGQGSAAVSATTWQATAAGTTPAAKAPSSTPSPTHSGPAPMVGLYVKGVPASTAPLATFRTQTGVRPKLALYFSEWGQPFQAQFATTETDAGAIPLVQLETGSLNLGQIADGSKDGYLKAYAKKVRDFGHPVVISFGHEMNGDWYHWGWKRTTAATFVAAWRHLVTAFRDAGATNVTW